MDQHELKNTALAFLKKQHLLHLATLGANNQPEVASVVYGCDDQLHILFAARSKSRKFMNLQQNAQVGFSVTSEHDLITVQGEGIATVTNDPQKISALLNQLSGIGVESILAHWPPPIIKLKEGSYQVIEITPTWLRLGDFSGNHENDEDYFTQVI